MGKGDKKTRRGKIILGTSGVKRPKNKKKTILDSKVEKPEKDIMVEKKPVKKTKKKEAEPTA
jgi:30S ribosomal protein S31